MIVPALDEAEHLERLLPDLLGRLPGAEIVVVDGGSADRTADVVRRFPAVRHVAAERGRARQMNAGAAVATGDVLLFLHADTSLPAGAADAIAAALADAAVVAGRFDVRFTNPRWPFRMIAASMNWRSRATRISTGDQGLFVRRATFEAVGGFPAIPLMEDIEITRRLKRAGRIACLRTRATTSARRWERDGVARTIALMWTLRLLYFCGADPARLHRWYYGRAPLSDGRDGTVRVRARG